MKKILTTVLLLTVLLSAGCAGFGNSPAKTVEKFVSEYDAGNYDSCYELMSSDYKNETSLNHFVDICKDVNPDKYEFIEVTNEYVSDESAVVDVLVNESSVAIKFSLKNFIELEPEYEDVTKEISLINEEDGWKFTEFPYVLT